MFEITGASDKIEQFIALMLPLGLVEVSRTGIVAIARGPEGMYDRWRACPAVALILEARGIKTQLACTGPR